MAKLKNKSIECEINDDNNNKSTEMITVARPHKVATTTLQHVLTHYSMIDNLPGQWLDPISIASGI